MLMAFITIAGTVLTLMVLNVYGKSNQAVAMDLAPLLTPAAPLNEEDSRLSRDLAIFETRNIFQEIVTPIPTPTKVPQPSPTPTPIPLAQGWKLNTIAPDMAAFTTLTNEFVMLNVGEEYAGARLVEVDTENNSITVEGIIDGNRRTLNLGANN